MRCTILPQARRGTLPGLFVILVFLAAGLAGCSDAGGGGGITPPPEPPPPPPPPAPSCEPSLAEAQRLFDQETFGGNGRTCATCHTPETGTITLADVARRMAEDPDDPLFRHDGLDDGAVGTSRLLAHGTIRVELELPPYVSLADSPGQRTIVVHRGVPSTVNMDTRAVATLMYDLRHTDLERQAEGAIRDHAQGTATPTDQQLSAIACFQKTDPRFFSGPDLMAFLQGTRTPLALPAARTPSESRARLFFEDLPLVGTRGACAACHSGHMLNEVNSFGAQAVGLPAGAKFGNVLVAEQNANRNPTFTFLIDGGQGGVRLVTLPDPGILLTGMSSPNVAPFLPSNAHPAQLAGSFRTPSLWGVRHRAPFFHDNSAKTLRDVVDHYADFFFPTVGITLTEQDRIDITAFLERF